MASAALKEWILQDLSDIPLFDWSGHELDREEQVRSLRVGDIVRVIVMERENEESPSWEKVYAKITDISHYSKTSDHAKPKTFTGIVMDTYRTEENFVRNGESIRFQSRNILEVPGWHETPPSSAHAKQDPAKVAAVKASMADPSEKRWWRSECIEARGTEAKEAVISRALRYTCDFDKDRKLTNNAEVEALLASIAREGLSKWISGVWKDRLAAQGILCDAV
jgi:hypothetical protein